jgi:hypothetical protein
MRKWTITLLVVVALATLGVYARLWLPKVLPVLRNHENADLLKSIVSVVQISFWIIGGVTFIFRLWHPKKKNADKKTASADKRAQSGGISISGGELRAYGDLVGRDKIEGDTVAGIKSRGTNTFNFLPCLSSMPCTSCQLRLLTSLDGSRSSKNCLRPSRPEA